MSRDNIGSDLSGLQENPATPPSAADDYAIPPTDWREFFPAGYIVLDRNAVMRDLNMTAAHLLSAEAGDLKNRKLTDFFLEDDASAFEFFLRNLEEHKITEPCDLRVRQTNGSPLVHVRLMHLPLPDPAGYHHLSLSDVSETQRLSENLRRSSELLIQQAGELEQHRREVERFSSMVSLLQACVSGEEAKVVINRSLGDLFPIGSGGLYLLNAARNHLEPAALWGVSPGNGHPIAPRDCWALRLGRLHERAAGSPDPVCAHVKHETRGDGICIPLTALGETLGLLHLELNGQQAGLGRKRHLRQLAVAVAENIALSFANFKLRDTLYVQSIHDDLTGLYNRRYMAEYLEKELHRAARKRLPVGIIILDIDRFKDFNDTHGHEAGDLVLRDFSGFLLKNVREEDFACRYGGDEFVIVMPEAGLETARHRAEQLRERVKHLVIEYRTIRLAMLTLSLGVAVYPNNGLSADELLRAADSALYRAKADGRDAVGSPP